MEKGNSNEHHLKKRKSKEKRAKANVVFLKKTIWQESYQSKTNVSSSEPISGSERLSFQHTIT
ncbi:MAG: hypothetical protein B5M49_04960 [Thermotoga sp. 4484_232]|nr:MAG: hypothetical protein B5M49_04960 [Thermotoga sp. 4484_232]